MAFKKTSQGMYNAPKVRLPQDLHKQLEDLVYDIRDRRATITSMVEKAVRLYLSRGLSPGAMLEEITGECDNSKSNKSTLQKANTAGNLDEGYFRDSLRAHYLLELILRSDIEPFAQAILANVEAFASCSEVINNKLNASPDRSYNPRLPDSTDTLRRRIEELIEASKTARSRVTGAGPRHPHGQITKENKRLRGTA